MLIPAPPGRVPEDHVPVVPLHPLALLLLSELLQEGEAEIGKTQHTVLYGTVLNCTELHWTTTASVTGRKGLLTLFWQTQVSAGQLHL